jgi:hypothetical protein
MTFGCFLAERVPGGDGLAHQEWAGETPAFPGVVFM